MTGALRQGLSLLALTLVLSGCATFRSYDSELSGSLSRARAGDLEGAISALGGEGKNGDLLYFMELGELLRQKHDVGASETAWIKADRKVLAWENAARTNASRLAGSVGSYLLNDKVRAYEGHDFEKVMLTTRLALNHLAAGDFERARVAIKRSHEREALIAALRAKEVESLEKEAREQGARIQYKDLGGYPTSTIDTPTVNALRNSYQSAFSHYLAGFVYEALGETSLAAPGYRQAVELRPGVAMLEEALAGLDGRGTGASTQDTDVLFVVESGSVPGRRSEQFPLPILSGHHWSYVPFSFPVLTDGTPGPVPTSVDVAGVGSIPVHGITDLDSMARRSLQDEFPGIMLRATVRSAVKGVAMAQTSRNDRFGLAMLAITLGAWLTESSDERGWRTLPGLISIARARLPRGEHSVTLRAPNRDHPIALRVAGTHMVVALRLMDDQLYMLAPGQRQAGDSAPAPARRARSGAPAYTSAAVPGPLPRMTFHTGMLRIPSLPTP